jgi:cobalamin-dependent methionine synthase I
MTPQHSSGVHFAEPFHMMPEQCANTLGLHHPQVKYFVV